MSIKTVEYIPTENSLPVGLQGDAIADWASIYTVFSTLDPWVVGRKARDLYFSLLENTDRWSLIFDPSKEKEAEDVVGKLKSLTGVSLSPLLSSQGHKSWQIEFGLMGWSVDNNARHLTAVLSGVSPIDFIAAADTAFDGLAIRMRDKFILMSHEFSMGRNMMLRNNPSASVAQSHLLFVQAAMQGV